MKNTSHLPLFLKSGPASLFLLLGLLFGSASAASIAGRVRDANTNTYPLGVHVAIRELGRAANTQSDGTFDFANVPAGDYTLVAAYTGYDDVTQAVRVIDGTEARADFTIGAEVLKLEKYVVSGEREG